MRQGRVVRGAALVVDADTMMPSGVLVACPESAIAILGVDRPTRVQCNGLRGHVGDHEFRVTWANTTSKAAS